MRHFLEQFGPCLQWPWTKLTDVPDLDDELINRIVTQSDEQAAGRTVSELEDERDANLVAMLKSLRVQDSAAGAFLNNLSSAHLS
jgi:carnitine 3-dehydrogenase